MASALVNPCDISVTYGSNTGIECDSSLGVAKGFFLVPGNYSWSKTDMADPFAFITARIHAAGASRWYPVLKGIFDFALSKESSVTEANPITGTTRTIRPGGFTITYTFEKGGLCLAQALLSFLGKGYSFVAVDQNSQFLCRLNADGTYSGLKSTEVTPDLAPATQNTSFKNIVVLSISYYEYVHYAKLLKSNTDITDFNGLIEIETTKAAAASTTKLKVGVVSECANTDLVALYGTVPMADVDLYVVTNAATGAVVTISSAAVVNGIVELTGTFVSGQTYNVAMAIPSILIANLLQGYEGVKSSAHAIP